MEFIPTSIAAAPQSHPAEAEIAGMARELGMCYSGLALVTDYDAGVQRDEAVTMETVFRVLAENIERVKGVLLRAIPAIPASAGCDCGAAAMDVGMNST